MLHLIWQLSTCQKTRPWHVTFCSRPNCSSHSSNNTAFAAASEDWASCSISLCFDGVGVYRCEKAKQTEEQKMVKNSSQIYNVTHLYWKGECTEIWDVSRVANS